MSCLFNSFSAVLETKTCPNALRQQVCDFIQAKSETLLEGISSDVLLGKPLEQYVRQMRSTSTWGGGIEIKAVCELHGVNVRVRCANNKEIEFCPTTVPVKQCVVLNWTGSHYTPA